MKRGDYKSSVPAICPTVTLKNLASVITMSIDGRRVFFSHCCIAAGLISSFAASFSCEIFFSVLNVLSVSEKSYIHNGNTIVWE